MKTASQHFNHDSNFYMIKVCHDRFSVWIHVYVWGVPRHESLLFIVAISACQVHGDSTTVDPHIKFYVKTVPRNTVPHIVYAAFI